MKSRNNLYNCGNGKLINISNIRNKKIRGRHAQKKTYQRLQKIIELIEFETYQSNCRKPRVSLLDTSLNELICLSQLIGRREALKDIQVFLSNMQTEVRDSI